MQDFELLVLVQYSCACPHEHVHAQPSYSSRQSHIPYTATIATPPKSFTPSQACVPLRPWVDAAAQMVLAANPQPATHTASSGCVAVHTDCEKHSLCVPICVPITKSPRQGSGDTFGTYPTTNTHDLHWWPGRPTTTRSFRLPAPFLSPQPTSCANSPATASQAVPSCQGAPPPPQTATVGRISPDWLHHCWRYTPLTAPLQYC